MANLPDMPPYTPGIRVTPLSAFEDHVWAFPKHWVPVNVQRRSNLDFLTLSVFGEMKISLVPGKDDKLIEQLKQLLIAYMFRRSALREGRNRLGSGRPTGFFAYLQHARRLFCWLKFLRFSSLSEIRSEDFSEIISYATGTQRRFDTARLVLEDLISLSKRGLITDHFVDVQPALTQPNSVRDTTAELGIQPIPDETVATLINLSLQYIRLAPVIAEKLAMLVNNPGRHRLAVLGWAQANLPCGSQLVNRLTGDALMNALSWSMQVSAGHLFCFYVGPRASELLSVSPWCVMPGKEGATLLTEHMSLEFETVKGVGYVGGAVRKIPAHPMLNDAADVADIVRSIFSPYSERLFVSPMTGETYNTNTWNYALQRFCDLHLIDYKISSHQWRKTVASICSRVLVGSAMHLKEVLGHKGLATLARYMLASPFIRAEIRDSMLDTYRKRGHTLLESLSIMGGQGLSGRGGQDLEARVRTLIADRDITQIDMKVQIDEWVEDMLAAGIHPLPVMPGVMCIKPQQATGACSRSSGDLAADVARCTPRCPFQVQQAHRHDLVMTTIRNIADKWMIWTDPQRQFWARSLRDLLKGWPQLPEDVQRKLDSLPTIRRMMDEAT
jgi:hypothetical protein